LTPAIDLTAISKACGRQLDGIPVWAQTDEDSLAEIDADRVFHRTPPLFAVISRLLFGLKRRTIPLLVHAEYKPNVQGIRPGFYFCALWCEQELFMHTRQAAAGCSRALPLS
jgi:hypothetical protein